MKKWNSVCCVTALVCSLFLQGCVTGAKAEVNLTPILENSPSSFLCIKDNSLGVFSAETKEFTELETFSKKRLVELSGKIHRGESVYFCVSEVNKNLKSSFCNNRVFQYNTTTEELQQIFSIYGSYLYLENIDEQIRYFHFFPQYGGYDCWFDTTEMKLIKENKLLKRNIVDAFFTNEPGMVIASTVVRLDPLFEEAFKLWDLYKYELVDLTGATDPIYIGYGRNGAISKEGKAFFFEDNTGLSFYNIPTRYLDHYEFDIYSCEWGILGGASAYLVENSEKIYTISSSFGKREVDLPIGVPTEFRVFMFQNDLYLNSIFTKNDKLYRISSPLSIEPEIKLLYEASNDYADPLSRSIGVWNGQDSPYKDSYLLKSEVNSYIMTRLLTPITLRLITIHKDKSMETSNITIEDIILDKICDSFEVRNFLSSSGLLLQITSIEPDKQDEEDDLYVKPDVIYIYNSKSKEIHFLTGLYEIDEYSFKPMCIFRNGNVITIGDDYYDFVTRLNNSDKNPDNEEINDSIMRVYYLVQDEPGGDYSLQDTMNWNMEDQIIIPLN